MTTPKIHFEDKRHNYLDEYLVHAEVSRIFVLVDKNTEKYCLPNLLKLRYKFIVIAIKPGEANKNLNSTQKIWHHLFKYEASRNDILLCLGGGMILDIGGFAASAYKRGMKFIFLPTSLLAMVDATIGGKTAINHLGFKNSIGLFQNPEKIFINLEYLHTLPKREYNSGLAEVIKHYLIASKQSFQLFSNEGLSDELTLVQKAIGIKTKIVNTDFKELNQRKKLNAGHTIAHAIESISIYKHRKVLHGEAVAIGLYYESKISVGLGILKKEDFFKIETVLKKYFKIPILKKNDIEDLYPYMLQDKKNKNGIIQMALIDKIGNCLPSVPVKKEDLKLITKILN